MRKNNTISYLALAIFLFCWINLPKKIFDPLRSIVVRPIVDTINEDSGTGHLNVLELENQYLKSQIENVFDVLKNDQKNFANSEILKETAPFYTKKLDHFKNLLEKELVSLPAKVVYRDPTSWSSSLWINIGEKDNEALSRNIICKNSPVVSKGALVGVVDYVGKSQSRVRLITDSGLCPSVQVVRGSLKQREIQHHFQALIQLIQKEDDTVQKELINLKDRLKLKLEDGYLAKGELHGSSAPFWRSRSPILQGIGFNYDFIDADNKDLSVEILKEGDLVVTSGLDGVFPQGIKVGVISKVFEKKEGSSHFKIEVRPMVNYLNDLQTVFVLPPLE